MTILPASTSLVPQNILRGHLTPEESSTPNETEETELSSEVPAMEGGQGYSLGVKDSLQGSVPGGAAGEVMLRHKKLSSQSRTRKQLKRSSSTFFLLVHMGRPQLPEGRGLAEVTGWLETALDPGGLQDGGVPLATVQAEAVSTQRVQKVVFQAGALGVWAGRGGTLVSSSKAGPAATSQPWAALPLAWPSPGWPYQIRARSSPALSSLGDRGRSQPLSQEEPRPEDRQSAPPLPAPRR